MTGFIEFSCPHCTRSIRTSARFVGKKGQCPHCGKPVKVETPAGQPAPAAPAEPPGRPATTHANTLLAGLFGAGATAILYLGFLAVHSSWVGALFLDRGPIQPIITFVTCWGLAILVLKYRAVRQQVSYTEVELEFLPLEPGFKISPQNVGVFLEHLEALPKKARRSILGRRIQGALEHFRERNSVPEVQSYLASHGVIDASMVDSGYTLLRAFIWAIPLFGFIGTVTGISTAVTGLADSLKTASPESAAVASAEPGTDPEGAAGGEKGSLGGQMIKAMGLVTQGLATAFDTTFLGLVTAILLLFPTETLKRIEYNMLDRIETFANESLLRRMSDEQDVALSPDAARLLEPVFRKHQQWLIEWQQQVAQLGQVIGGDFEQHAAAIGAQLERCRHEQTQELVQLAQSVGGAVEQARGLMEGLRGASAGLSHDLTACCDRLQAGCQTVAGGFRALQENTTDLQQRLLANAEQTRGLADQWQAATAAAARAVEGGRLEQALESIDRHVARLAEIVARAEQGLPAESGDGAPRRRRWLFGRA